MEVPQENSLGSYLQQPKMSIFSHLLFIYKIGEKEGKTGPAWGDWYQWEGEKKREMVKKGEYGVNTVYICM
jgi:hypothetical protein